MQTPPAQPKVDISTCPSIECSNGECASIVFLRGLMLKTVSKLLTGSPEDQVVPLEVLVCSSCDTPLEDSLPNNNTPQISPS